MTYKVNVAVCAEIRIKYSTQSMHHVELFNVKAGGRVGGGTGALHVQRRERPLSVKEETMGEKWPIQFCLQPATSTVSVGIFYMLQIYDMGQTALLPLRRKAC
jgi:hypothetical protein